MRARHILCIAGVATLGFVSLASTEASARFILGLDSGGVVYQIDTTDASATLFGKDLPNVDPVSNQELNSPNALAFDGTAVYGTPFGGATTAGVPLYRSTGAAGTATTVGNLPITGGPNSQFSIAAADIVDNTYVYVDRRGTVRTFDLNTSTSGVLGTVPLAARGDIAIAGGPGDRAFISRGRDSRVIDQFDLTTNTWIGPSTVDNPTGSYAGLAFANGELFGVTGGNGDISELYRLTSSGALLGAAALIGTVLSGGVGVSLTDAAFVPLPAAAWMVLTALAGFFGLQRYTRRTAQAAAAP